VFNIQPGTGLGFAGSKQIALGLGNIGEAVEYVYKILKDIRTIITEQFSITWEPDD